MPARDERPVRRARRVAWAWRGRAPSTHGTLYSPTPPQQAPADIGCSHALEDGLGALPELTGRRTDPSPPARAPALALSRAQRPAGGTSGPAAHCSGCPINLPPAHLPLALPRASDWVPVGRRWARPAARLRNALGWVGRARIFVWSVPAGASGLPPEAAALFLSLSAVPPPSPAVPAPFCRAGRWPGSPSVADLEWVGLGGSGRCCLGREASAISVDRWGKPQNWPRQSPGTRRGIAPLPARRMARFDRLTRFF